MVSSNAPAPARAGPEAGMTELLAAADELAELFPRARRAPIVSVLDGHPHTLAFLAAFTQTPISCLGVSDFGQSGDVQDLYRYAGIDADTIVGAALDLLA